MSIYSLIPLHDRARSFYSKAKIYEDSTSGIKYLVSYHTLVASFDHGRMTKHWDGYSQTTMRHINEAARQFVGMTVTKKDWERMPVVPMKKKIAVGF